MIVIDVNGILGFIGGIIGGAILLGIVYQLGKAFWEWFTEPATNQKVSQQKQSQPHTNNRNKTKELQIRVHDKKK